MFLTAVQTQHRTATRCTLADLQGRALAAARLSMRGDRYTAEDRADCAADALQRTLAAADGRRPTGRPADVLAYVAAVDSAPQAAAPQVWRAMVPGARIFADTVPADVATMSRLMLLAANYRRGLDRQRDRDTAQAAARAASGEGFTPHVVAADDWHRDPTTAAHAAARDALATLGLSRLGRCYPAALLAALAAHGYTPEEAAQAAGYASPDSAKKARQRASARIPSATTHTLADHLAAAGLLDDPNADTGTTDRDIYAVPGLSRDAPNEWRTAPRTAAAVTCTTAAAVAADAPQWARDLSANAARRMAAAAEYRRARAAARTASETQTLRLAHGLPATVR